MCQGLRDILVAGCVSDPRAVEVHVVVARCVRDSKLLRCMFCWQGVSGTQSCLGLC